MSYSVIPKYKDKPIHHLVTKYEGPDHFDAIVIGSGIGGMTASSALAKYGYKVLVLEQHYVPGGYTHMFTRKGFHWDVGVHAIGEMDGPTQANKIFKWVTSEKVKWESLGKTYERFFYPDDYDITFPDTKPEFISKLKNEFPDEANKIDTYLQTIKKATNEAKVYFANKFLPPAIAKPVSFASKFIIRDWWTVTTEEVLDELGLSDKLKTVLTSQWGYHGSTPVTSSFAMHALVKTHFYWGAFYPVGGSKTIAESMLANVKDAGGEVICRAKVSDLIFNKNQTKVSGVKLDNGKEFHAPIVISAMSTKRLVKDILPEKVQKQEWATSISKLKSSPAYICMNLAFEGADIKELGASSHNQWFCTTYARDIADWDFTKEKEPHILYVSFPSLKDPKHEPGEKIMHTGEAVTFVPYEIFKKWENTSFKKRPEDYKALKADMEEKIVSYLKKRMPKLMEKCVYFEISTPLTANFFDNADGGSIYGLEATPERFNCKHLKPRTPIKGLYLSGVDIATTGVMGGMMSGMLTACSIEKKVIRHMLS